MMPGETPPAANTVAIATEAATACANCGALQQNLNEYVAALIALKQKIIDADHLLTEYQQKCNELQFAKRENNTLHHQVEQMVQKISPLKKCQEELGSVKAELEEKKSSLKIYQETHLEFVRVKEEMDKSDNMKKKLEFKVKKLEEAAAKHTQEFKQLKAEKKVLEKELKKAQEKIDGVPNKKQKKVLKNAETQSESLATNVDKVKIKLLLEELWQCIEGSTGKRQINAHDHILADFHNPLEPRGKRKALQNPKKMKKAEGRRTSGCSSELSTTQVPLMSLQMKVDKMPIGYGGPIENKSMETCNSAGASDESRSIKMTADAELAISNIDFLNKEQEEFNESLRDALKWIRPLPPLLSPLQFSPAATPDMLFGDITDSSDDEMDQNAQRLENIIEKCDENKPTSNNLPSIVTDVSFFSTSSVKTDHQEPHKSVRKLKSEESVALSDSVTTTLKYLNESNTKSKDEEKHLEENSDYIQMCTSPKVAAPDAEKLSEKVIDMIETKDSIPLPGAMSNDVERQEENIEPMLFQERMTNNIDRVLEETNDFIQKEKEEFIETTEADWCQVPKCGDQQETKELILTAETPLIPSKTMMALSSGERDVAENVKAEFDSGKAIVLCEKHAEHKTAEEQSVAPERKSEPLIEDKINVSTYKFLSETNHISEQAQQQGTTVVFTESIEKDVYLVQPPLSSHCLEETCNRQSESDVNGKNESGDTLRSNSRSVMLTNELKQSPYPGNEIISTGSKAFAKNVADGTTKESKSDEVQKEKCPKQELSIDENQIVKSPLQESDYERNDRLSAQAPITKDSERPVEAGHAELENYADSASQPGQIENAGIKPECMSSVSGLNSGLEDFCPLRKKLMEKNCESVKFTEMEKTQELSEKTSLKTLYNIELSSTMPEHLETEKNNVAIINDVSDAKKFATGNKEMNDKYSVTNEVDTVQNIDEGSLQSIENISQADSGDTGSRSPNTMASYSIPRTESVEVTASNFEVSIDFFGRNRQNSDAASISSFVPDCIALSAPNREDANHVQQHNSEDQKSKKTTTAEPKGERHKLWNCDSSYNKKDEAEIEQDKGDGIASELQASVAVKSLCREETFEMLTPEAACLNNTNTIDICVENTLLLSHEELIIPCDKNGTSSENEAVDYTLDEETAKEADDLMSTEIRSKGTEEFSVLITNASVSDSSEEVYSLRKVNCTKINPEFAVSGVMSHSVKNSEVALLTNMPVSDDAGHEMSPVVPGGEISEDEKAEKHNSGSQINEVVERTWEHSYAAVQPCDNQNAALKMEDSLAIDKGEERQRDSVSLVASLPSQDLIDHKAASGKSSGDPDVKDDRVAVHTKYISSCQVQPELIVEELNVEQKSISISESSSSLEQTCNTVCHVNDDTGLSHNEIHDVNNDKQIISSNTSWKSVSPISKKFNATDKQKKVETAKLEPQIAFPKNSAEQIFSPSNSDFIKAQSDVSGADGRPICKRKRKNHSVLLTKPILANAITFTPAEGYPKSLTKIMQEMGPPLPPLLPPLIATPPRIIRPTSPVMSTSSHSSLPSPLDDLISSLRETPVSSLMSTSSENSKRKSSSSSSTFTTLSPCEMSVDQRTLSSPLQFCAATPKHALPVPGRLPLSAVGNAAPSGPQENSVEMLDSMYPELSARARTLNILRGNVRFSESSSLDVKKMHQISGYKAITSTSTAFVKTGTVFKFEPEKRFPSVNETGKKILASVAVPKSAKRPRLDSKSSTVGLGKEELLEADIGCPPDDVCLDSGSTTQSSGVCNSELVLEKESTDDSDQRAMTLALEQLSEACFDLLPVIRSHVLVGNTSKVPVMRDEEKHIVYELGVEKKSLAEPALQAILKKLKTQKVSLSHNYIQSLCRVYVGICRQLGDLEKARLFCYTLLKEDFPRSAHLILFITNVWREIFTSESVINKAIQLVVRQRAKGEVLKCLKTYLNWEESSSVDISMMISSLLWAIQVCPQMEFQMSREYGEDLKENIWQYVFAIDLLCSHKKWCWTHDNIISKELWPIMDNWIKNRKSNGSISSPSDIIMATVLRLIGRLGQIGLREGFFSPVENISSVIGAFLQHSKEKGVAWGVQLAALYALLDLGPSNPSRILEAIHAWKAVNTISLPSAVLNGIAEVNSLLTHTEGRKDCSSA